MVLLVIRNRFACLAWKIRHLILLRPCPRLPSVPCHSHAIDPHIPPPPAAPDVNLLGPAPHHLGPNSHLGFGPAAFVAPRCSGPSLSPLGPGEEGGGFFPQATAGVNCLLRPLSFIAFHLHLQSASPIQLNLKRVMYAGG